ncbi:hypothetical protein M405DRAFT_827610 [Rhizopogon salebrosus TDB-379]|nr:hypothetical protein M405DRAFT_827610 [Rhizopogon salebrosus TDB-379]
MNLLHHLNQFTVSHAQCASMARQRRAPRYCSKISTLQVDIPQIKIGQRYDAILVAI